MLYQLLPFFLAFQVPTDNGTWTFGPEYIFSGHAKMITALERDKGVLMGNKMIFKLKCRPKINDTLSCHFEDTKISKIMPNAFNVSAGEKSEEYKVVGLMKSRFEIKFNEKGIDSYMIEKTEPRLPSWCLDMTRLICNQLSIGANIAETRDSSFRTLENYTTGECEVDFTVTDQSNQSIAVNANGDFELLPLDNLGRKIQGQLLQIDKKRDVDDCLVCADYFFGSRHIYGLVYRDVFTKLKSSNSRILVSEKILIAETVNEVELFGENRKKQGNVLDHMMLKLESVLPAKEELPMLKDLVSMEIIANRPGSPYVE